MFFRRPIDLSPKPTASSVPEGPAVQAARARVEDLKAAIRDAEDQKQTFANHVQDAEKRLAEAATKRNQAEEFSRRAALGEDVPKPSAYQLAGLIESHAVAESEAAKVRRRSAAETDRLEGELLKLRAQLIDAEHAVKTARFQELVGMYRDAIRPLIPLASTLREAAADVGRRCECEPLLIDPDADYGRQLFGATI